jgi:ribonuclease J
VIAVELVQGVGRLGAHHHIVDLGADSFVVDAGGRFPAPWEPWVERWLPPTKPIEQRRSDGRLRAVVLTHGHLDHIGGLGSLASVLRGVPVLGTRWALTLLRRQLERAGFQELTLREVEAGQAVVVGETELTWLRVTHSLPEACSVVFRSSAGAVAHSGDFRVQPSPLLGPPCDVAGLRSQGDRGIDLALVDSTNAGRPGSTLAEARIEANLRGVFARLPGRVVVTTFSSHLERLRAIVSAAASVGRQVALSGGSLVRGFEDAVGVGVWPLKEAPVLPVEAVMDLPRRQVLVVATGCQGEPRASLARIARDEDSRVRVVDGDHVVWSARVIPGNERSVAGLVNRLVGRGVSVQGLDWGAGLHGSGHGHAEEVAQWLSWVRPQHVVPVHGEEQHLLAHRERLASWGFAPDRVHQPRSGERLVLRERRGTVEAAVAGVERVQVGRAVWAADEPALRQRKRLSEGGMVQVVLAAGRAVGVHTAGVFAEHEREQREADLLGLLTDGAEGDREQLRLVALRAVRELTGCRPLVDVRSVSIPSVVENA